MVFFANMVGKEGLEPSRPHGQWILSPQRLPFRHFPFLSFVIFGGGTQI